MKSAALLQAGVLALTCSILATNANAAIINVDNSSFETLPVGGLPTACGPGCSFGIGAIAGWTNGGITGQFQPGNPANTTYFDSLSNGPTSAFSNGGTISQIVVPTVQLGVTYTLLVDIGSRSDSSPAGSAALLINGVQYFATGLFLPGSFTTFTATYTAVNPLDAGSAIAIQLLSSGSQGNYDNVRLSDDTVGAVPEPGTIALMGMGLTALGILRRKFAK